MTAGKSCDERTLPSYRPVFQAAVIGLDGVFNVLQDGLLWAKLGSLGRAWAVFFLMDRTFNTEAGPATSGPTPTLVPGLSYQPDTQEIRFVEPGQPPVVCARVVPKKFLFFHWNKVVPTGQCGITRIEDRVNTTDTGFGLAKSRERGIYFGRAPQGRASL